MDRMDRRAAPETFFPETALSLAGHDHIGSRGFHIL